MRLSERQVRPISIWPGVGMALIAFVSSRLWSEYMVPGHGKTFMFGAMLIMFVIYSAKHVLILRNIKLFLVFYSALHAYIIIFPPVSDSHLFGFAIVPLVVADYLIALILLNKLAARDMIRFYEGE